MGKFELFLHDQLEATPLLLKTALAHVQFETIFCRGFGMMRDVMGGSTIYSARRHHAAGQ